MLPFGFVSAPVTVYLLAKDPVIAFSIANWLSFVEFFEWALDAGEEVAGGFKLINRIFILHTMLQTLAKRSGRDPQDLFSHSYYKVCARIGEEFRNNASSLL